MLNTIKSALVICGLVLAVSSFDAKGLIAQVDGRDKNRLSISIHDADEDVVLQTISRRTRVPIGFSSLKESNRAQITLSRKDATASELLDEFVRLDSKYIWSASGGVVNVLPRSGDTLLDTRISRVAFKATPAADAEFTILKLPEVKRALDKLEIIPADVAVSFGRSHSVASISMELKDLTLRDLLNELLKRGYCTYWRIDRYGTSQQFIRLNLY